MYNSLLFNNKNRLFKSLFSVFFLLFFISNCAQDVDYNVRNRNNYQAPQYMRQQPVAQPPIYQQNPYQNYQPYYYGAPNSRQYYNPYDFAQPYGRNPYSDYDQYYVLPNGYRDNDYQNNRQPDSSKQ
jgi:hypothetical protein